MPTAVTAAVQALRQVLGNRDLRRALLAWMLGYATEGAWLVALVIYAYAQGGVVAAGAVGLARTLPAAVLSPALSTLADRLPRRRVLLAVHTGRALVIGAAALVAASGWPPEVVYGLAAAEGLFSVLHRPSHASLMPALARSPDDLVAANAASSTFEGIGTVAGPLVAGLVLATSTPVWSFAAPAIGAALAATVVAGVHPQQSLRRSPLRRGIGDVFLGGLRALVEHPAAGLIIGLFFAQVIVRGLLAVLLVVTAVELLMVGDEGVGWLNAAIGIGGFVGAMLAMGLVGRARLAPAFSAGLVAWGAPILVIGLVPQAFLALVLLGILGVGNAVLDVAGYTIVQRAVPNAVRGRVFGVLEALVMLGLAIGSFLAPIMVAVLGAEGALVATGAILPTLALLTWRAVGRADAAGIIPERELRLLRGIPIFGALPLTVLEQVAGDLRPMHAAPGEEIIRQGEIGDRFYVVARGEAEARIDGQPVRRMSAGEGFGEIALLRDVPRTASVVAIGDVELSTLDREAFLCAVTGDRLSTRAAEAMVSDRMAGRG